MSGERGTVIVVGAGPVGAVLALGLAQRGFRPLLLEAENDVATAPRAATLHPSTLEMLDERGLMDEVVAQGLVARYFDFWDWPARRRIARFDHAVLGDITRFPFVVQLEQHKLVRIALHRLQEIPEARVLFNARVERIEQSPGSVRAFVTVDGHEVAFDADYLVGADGGRSTIRKGCGIEFEGFTWPERFLVLTTSYDLASEWDLSYRNYLADPAGWVNAFKVSGDDGQGRWRAVFPVDENETDEDALGDEASRRRLARLSAHEEAFDLLQHRNLYKVHQRVAATMRSGRVLIVGDAAHVNNPIGGLGLNSGVHDATDLIRTMDGLTTGDRNADEILDAFSERRRRLNVEFVQQQTIANKRRLEETDPAQREQRFAELSASAADPAGARAFLMRSSLLESVSLEE